MSYGYIYFETEQCLAVATAHPATRRNALSLRLMLELPDCLERLEMERELRGVILAAAD